MFERVHFYQEDSQGFMLYFAEDVDFDKFCRELSEGWKATKYVDFIEGLAKEKGLTLLDLN